MIRANTMRCMLLVALLSMTLLVAAVPGAAQDPPPLPGLPSAPDQDNITDPRSQFYAATLDILDSTSLVFGPTQASASVRFEITDISDPAMSLQSQGIRIECTLEPLTETGSFTATFSSSCDPRVPPGATRSGMIQVTRPVGGGPYSASWQVNVTMMEPVQKLIGTIVVTTWLEEFANLFLTPGIHGRVAPDTHFQVPLTFKNNGNSLGIFQGQLQEVPEGWRVVIPETVAVQAGEEVTVNVSVVSPRGKLYYMSESALISVRYTNVDDPQISRQTTMAVAVHGVFVPPQLVPFVLLSIGLLGVFIFFAVLARRAVEEQILGKPVPPWRIPVERDYLQQLARDDPDQYYVVRYYLMEEEHQSALLWYDAYKRATKQDRKRESAWVGLKNKQSRKIGTREKQHARLVKKWDRKVLRMEKKRDRRIRRLEKKLRRKERRKQKKFDKKFDKIVAKIQKKHEKKVEKATKRHERVLAKEMKKIDKKNKKREKNGEEPLPLPDRPAPDLGEPELPERTTLEEVPLESSRYAKRADRIRRYYGWRAERRRRRGDRLVRKDAQKRDIKIERLKAKIPPEPTTHLYDKDEYLSEDEIIVEDDRPFIVKLLHLPTLEERERARRRRQVYSARIKQAKAEGDDSRVKALAEAFAHEREASKRARKEEFDRARASDIENRRLMKERKRKLKERAKKMAKEAKGEAKAQKAALKRGDPAGPASQRHTVETEPVPQRVPAETRGPGRSDAPETSAPEDQADEGRTGFRARFKKRKEEAGAQEDKKERPESPEAAAGGSEDQR